MTLMTHNQKIQAVFAFWNSKKTKGWKGHGFLNKPANDAITQRLREGYQVEGLCKAIDNYALILLSKDYAWTYAWSLSKFFSVHIIKGGKWEGYQFTRFIEGEFYEDDYLTYTAKQKKIETERRKVQPKKSKKRPARIYTKEEIEAGKRFKARLAAKKLFDAPMSEERRKALEKEIKWD